jgi:hypothetical protein
MRPDPYLGSYDSSNPQSLNRYGYVLNNPLAAADPEGLANFLDSNGCYHEYVVVDTKTVKDPAGNDTTELVMGWVTAFCLTPSGPAQVQTSTGSGGLSKMQLAPNNCPAGYFVGTGVSANADLGLTALGTSGGTAQAQFGGVAQADNQGQFNAAATGTYGAAGSSHDGASVNGAYAGAAIYGQVGYGPHGGYSLTNSSDTYSFNLGIGDAAISLSFTSDHAGTWSLSAGFGPGIGISATKTHNLNTKVRGPGC